MQVWENWWFWGLIIGSIITALSGILIIRIKNLEKRERYLEFQVKDRTEELMKAYDILRESDYEMAVVDERNRLARELHDSVTQSLYSLTLFSEAARHLAEESGHDKLEGYIEQIGSLGLQSLKEMRLLVFELGFHALEDDDLVEAIEKRLNAVEGRTGIDAKLINNNYRQQPPYIETQLFKIALEALNNSLKHAEATSVEVLVDQKGARLRMEIRDNGTGFDPQEVQEGPGMGLRNIKERVNRMDGELELISSEEEGTRIITIIDTDAFINKNK